MTDTLPTLALVTGESGASDDTRKQPEPATGLLGLTMLVRFNAVEAGHSAGLDVFGYTCQAQFLLNCGLAQLMEARQADGAAVFAALASGAQKSLIPQRWASCSRCWRWVRGSTGLCSAPLTIDLPHTIHLTLWGGGKIFFPASYDDDKKITRYAPGGTSGNNREGRPGSRAAKGATWITLQVSASGAGTRGHMSFPAH